MKRTCTPLTKYADDSTILAIITKRLSDRSEIALSTFMEWSQINCMPCNIGKCKELVLGKKGNVTEYPRLYNIKQCSSLVLLGVTLQSSCKFSEHVKINLCEANKCLFIIRSFRKKGCTQSEIDHLFKSIVLPKILYGLPVYAASASDLTVVQNFLSRCYKRLYTSVNFNILELLEKCDRRLFNKCSRDKNHPLYDLLPTYRETCIYTSEIAQVKDQG
jgi:hypothetical protein